MLSIHMILDISHVYCDGFFDNVFELYFSSCYAPVVALLGFLSYAFMGLGALCCYLDLVF